ncbi:MAG: Uncharacterized protein LiPW15_234 [Parcubacteria group bacterium LiPW_15]|nr:MAG: Uncharacterized protein LiPW15_234 [Parcubacteria group bacterium LiPW_15]
MELKELNKFIKLENGRLREAFGEFADEDKHILERTVKLTEELGELCDEVLGHCSFQRKSKPNTYDSDNLPGEVADVLITTLLLADTMNVDVEKALEMKIEKINKRYEK